MGGGGGPGLRVFVFRVDHVVVAPAIAGRGAGLTVAIPSLIFHRYFRVRVDELVITMEQEALKMVEALHGPAVRESADRAAGAAR